MGGFSWDNPFPMYLDDGPTEIELAYLGLREAAGELAGNPAESALAPRDVDPLVLSSLADLEVKCNALAIGVAASDVEHALWEQFPDTMIDQLGGWEKLLAISPIAATVLERQRAVTLATIRIPDATVPGLARALFPISPKLALDPLDADLATYALFGKNLGPLDGVPGALPYRTGNAIAAFGNSSSMPAFADAFVVRVRYLLEDGETAPAAGVIRDAKATLLEILPAWATFEVYTRSSGDDGDGFYFDGGPNNDSFFDVTAFGDT